MGIPIEREPEGLGPDHERCIFCRLPTVHWATSHDIAVCPDCAPHHEASELPTKREWCQGAGFVRGR